MKTFLTVFIMKNCINITIWVHKIGIKGCLFLKKSLIITFFSSWFYFICFLWWLVSQ